MIMVYPDTLGLTPNEERRYTSKVRLHRWAQGTKSTCADWVRGLLCGIALGRPPFLLRRKLLSKVFALMIFKGYLTGGIQNIRY